MCRAGPVATANASPPIQLLMDSLITTQTTLRRQSSKPALPKIFCRPDSYVFWCRAFIRWHGLRHPAEMAGPEVEAFLSYLAAERGLAPSSHRQALSALLFLYGKVLGVSLPWMTEIGRPQTPRRLPVVLSVEEVVALFTQMDEGVHRLLARLLYGTGLRISEALHRSYRAARA